MKTGEDGGPLKMLGTRFVADSMKKSQPLRETPRYEMSSRESSSCEFFQRPKKKKKKRTTSGTTDQGFVFIPDLPICERLPEGPGKHQFQDYHSEHQLETYPSRFPLILIGLGDVGSR